MPYKNKEDQYECYKRWYQRNKDKHYKNVKLRKRKIQKWFKELKKTLKCIKCGESHPSCLDFHHPDSINKDINISEMVSNGFSINRIKKEIKNCIVLCSNCHRKLHYNNREPRA